MKTKHDRTQNQKPLDAVANEEIQRVPGIDGGQNRRLAQDPPHAQPRQAEEPQHHHRPEQRTDAPGPTLLHHEQAEEDRRGERHYPIAEDGCRELEPFDGARALRWRE